MIRAFRLALVASVALAPSLALAQLVQYQAPDRINQIPVSAATPLPVTGGGGSVGTPSIVGGASNAPFDQGPGAITANTLRTAGADDYATLGTANITSSTTTSLGSASGFRSASVRVSGTFVATFFFAESFDGGASFVALTAVQNGSAYGTLPPVQSGNPASAAGVYRVNIDPGATLYIIPTYTSGTLTATAYGGGAYQALPYGFDVMAGSAGTAIGQGATGTSANSQTVQGVSGGNPVGTVGYGELPYPATAVTATGATYNATTGVASFTALNQTILIDTYQMPATSILTSGTFVGTITWTGSDNSAGAFSTLPGYPSSNFSTSGASSSSNAAGQDIYFTNPTRYILLTATSYTSGTINVQLTARSHILAEKSVYIGGGGALTAAVNAIVGSTAALGSGATFTGTGVAYTATMNYFNCRAYADQTGTLNLQQSDDSGANYFTVATASIPAGAPGAFARVTMTGSSAATLYRCQVVNGATAETVLRQTQAMTVN